MVERVQVGIIVVVGSTKPRVQRPFRCCFFCVNFTVIVRVLPGENFCAATEDPEAVQ